MTSLSMRRLVLLACILVSSVGCDPCEDYCALECSCSFDDSEACRQICLDTIEVYTGTARTDECIARQVDLEEECG